MHFEVAGILEALWQARGSQAPALSSHKRLQGTGLVGHKPERIYAEKHAEYAQICPFLVLSDPFVGLGSGIMSKVRALVYQHENACFWT